RSKSGIETDRAFKTPKTASSQQTMEKLRQSCVSAGSPRQPAGTKRNPGPHFAVLRHAACGRGFHVLHSNDAGATRFTRRVKDMTRGTTRQTPVQQEQGIATALGRRSIVLVGMMGSGKSSVGRRLAA